MNEVLHKTALSPCCPKYLQVWDTLNQMIAPPLHQKYRYKQTNDQKAPTHTPNRPLQLKRGKTQQFSITGGELLDVEVL